MPFKKLLISAFLLTCSLTVLLAQNTLKNEVYFATDKHELTNDSRSQLDEVLKNLKTFKSYTLFIKGNTDADGSNAYNQALSEKRVARVKEYLIKNGVPTDAFNVVAVGEEEPIADNTQEDGKQKNRRVDIVVHYSIGEPAITKVQESDPLSIDKLFLKLSQESQSFTIETDKDTAIICAKGSMILIPAGSFDVPKGSQIVFKVKEILTTTDMLLENLATTAQGKLLNSGGMLHLSAQTMDGKTVQLKENKSLSIKVPTAEYEAQMQFFYGNHDAATNNVDWNLMNSATAASINNVNYRDKFFLMPKRPSIGYINPIDNERLSKFTYDYYGDNYHAYSYSEFKNNPRYVFTTNYYRQLSDFLTKDTCRELYDITKIDRIDTTTRTVKHGFFERVFQGKDKSEIKTSTSRINRTLYIIKPNLSKECAELAEFGKNTHNQKLSWEDLHRAKHTALYDILEKELKVKGYENLKVALIERAVKYDDRMVHFKKLYDIKKDSSNQQYERILVEWRKKIDAWQQKQAEIAGQRLAKGNISMQDINFYFFETNRLGWLNCDYFNNTQSAVMVNTNMKKEDNLDVKLVFQERMSAFGTTAKKGETITFQNVPTGRKAWIVAMQFYSDGPSLAIQEFETGKVFPNLDFKKMSVLEMRDAIAKLNNR